MISDQSQSAITGTKMTVSDLVSIAGYFFPTQDGLEDPIFSGEVTGHGHSPLTSHLPHVNIIRLAITGLGTFLIKSKSTCLHQPWKPFGKILNPTCTPTTPGGGTNRISYLPAPLLGLSLLFKLPKYILFELKPSSKSCSQRFNKEILKYKKAMSV